MSDALRTYAGPKKKFSRRRAGPVRPAGLGRALRNAALVMLLVLVAYVWWTTRDTHAVNALIPQGQQYALVASDILQDRGAIAESRVWNALPEQFRPTGLTAALGNELGLPEWVLNNLVPGAAYAVGNDLKSFSDVLLVTKMSRIGTLLERLHVFSGDVAADPAGGLELRDIAGGKAYYAVRGRVLLISPSREALVRALTLRPEDALDGEQFAALAEQGGAEQLRGRVNFGPDDPLGDVLENLRFALRIEPDRVQVDCRAGLSTEWRARCEPLLRNLSPRALKAPVDGMAVAAMDFGMPVKEFWLGIGNVTEWPLMSEEQWSAWEQPAAAGGSPSVAAVLTSLLGPLGPGVRLTWRGVDQNEIFPMPELVLTADVTPERLAALESIPPPPPEAMPWDPYPRYDAENGFLHVPMMAGPSLEPTAFADGSVLMLSTSRIVAEALSTEREADMPLDEKGNLFVRVYPEPCVETLVEAARQLVEIDALRGHDAASFADASSRWLEQASAVRAVSLLAGYEREEVQARLSLECAPVQ